MSFRAMAWTALTASALTYSGLTPATETYGAITETDEQWSRLSETSTTVVSAETSVTLSYATDGLVFRDDFDRADNDTIGNGWTEYLESNDGLRILNNELAFSGVGGAVGEADIARSDVTHYDSMILQVNLKGDFPGAFLHSWITSTDTRLHDKSDATSYYIRNRRNLNRIELIRNNAGAVTTPLTEAHGSMSATEWYGTRLIKDTLSDGSFVFRICQTDTLSAGTDIEKEFTFGGTSTYTDGTPFSASSLSMVGAFNEDLNEYLDELIVMRGTDIKVTGVLTGWQAKLDDRPLISESGNTVTISVITWALPGNTVTVTDSAGSTITSVTSTNGIWGGTVIDLSVTTGASSQSSIGQDPAVTLTYTGTDAVDYAPTRLKPFPDGAGGIDFLPTVQTPHSFLVSSDRPINIASRSAISSSFTAEGRP